MELRQGAGHHRLKCGVSGCDRLQFSEIDASAYTFLGCPPTLNVFFIRRPLEDRRGPGPAATRSRAHQRLRNVFRHFGYRFQATISVWLKHHNASGSWPQARQAAAIASSSERLARPYSRDFSAMLECKVRSA